MVLSWQPKLNAPMAKIPAYLLIVLVAKVDVVNMLTLHKDISHIYAGFQYKKYIYLWILMIGIF